MKVIFKTIPAAPEGDLEVMPSVPLTEKEVADMRDLGVDVQIMNGSEGAVAVITADTNADHMKPVAELLKLRLLDGPSEAADEAEVKDEPKEEAIEEPTEEVVEPQPEQANPTTGAEGSLTYVES